MRIIGMVTLDALGNIGDLIGGVAVLVTLVYLALQIRQNTNSVRGAAELESERMRMEWHAMAATNPDLAEIWERVFREPDSVSWQELGRFRWYIASYFFILEGSWFQHRRGLMDQSGWIPLQDAMLGLLTNQRVLDWWEAESSPFSQDFRKLVTGLLESGVDTGWRYQSHIDAHAQGDSESQSQ
jgi:hypothetical protein